MDDVTTSQTNAPASSSSQQDKNETDKDHQGTSTAEESGTNKNCNSSEVIEVTGRLDNSDDDDDSAVEIVDAATFREQQQQQAAATATANNHDNGDDSDEELQCVGTANETKLPHNRQDCLAFRYNNNNNNNSSTSSDGSYCCAETTLENAKFCHLCYCYVCDKPASECTNWYLGEKGVVIDKDGNGSAPEDKKQSSTCKTDKEEEEGNDCHLQQYTKNHCNATDKGSTKYLWKNMRTAIKAGRDPSVVTGNNATADNMDDSLAQYLARYTVPPPVAATTAATVSAATAARAVLAEQLRQRQRERHRYRAHATGRGGAHHRRTAQQRDDEEEGNYSSIYSSVSMDTANAMDFSSTVWPSSSRRSRAAAAAAPRRTRPAAAAGSSSGNNERPRHSNHRDRMRTQQILEDLYG